MSNKAAYKRRYRAAKPEQHREENKRYREAHPERVREFKRRWYLANRAKLIKRAKAWGLANQPKVRLIKKKWKQRNRAASQVGLARYRARKREATQNDFTVSQWRELLAAFDNDCAYAWLGGCSKERLTQDHLVPISRGGDHTLSNIVPACGSHNSSKSGKTALEYLVRRLP